MKVILIYLLHRFEIPQDHMYLSPAIGKSLKGCVVGMASADSAFVYHSTCSINDFNHPDLPALLVFIQYMTQVEVGYQKSTKDFRI